EQYRQALLDAVGDVERQSLDGRGGVHAAGGNPDAAIDDKEDLHVVATSPLIPPGRALLPPRSRHPRRIARDRRPPCRPRTSQAPRADPAWHTAAPGSRGCAEPGRSKTAAHREALCVPDG